MRFLLVVTTLLRGASAAELQGAVRDMTGVALSDAVVKLCPPGSRVAVASVRTDTAGRYAFSGVPTGAYDLEIGHAGFKITRVREIRLTDGIPIIAPPVAVEVSICGVPAPESLRFLHAPDDTGYLRGTVVGHDRKPIPGAKVSVACPGGRIFAAWTDAGGHFVVPALVSGHYLLTVEKQGYFTDEDHYSLQAGIDSSLLPIALGKCHSEVCPKRVKIVRCE